MRVYTLSDMQSEKKLRVYTASEAKGLMQSLVFMKFLSNAEDWLLNTFTVSLVIVENESIITHTHITTYSVIAHRVGIITAMLIISTLINIWNQ